MGQNRAVSAESQETTSKVIKPRKTDLKTGSTFGHWTVLKKVGVKNGSRQAFYLCRCSCGTEKEVNGSNLRTGISLSCGCMREKYYYNRDIFKEKNIDRDVFIADLGNLPMPELEQKYNISSPTVTRYRRKFNVTPPKETKEKAYKERIASLHQQGMSVKEIARQCNQSAVYVYNRLQRLGLNPHYVKQSCCVEAMSSADRSTWKGFNFYWLNRPFHFEELYGMRYSPLNAAKAFAESEKTDWGRRVYA